MESKGEGRVLDDPRELDWRSIGVGVIPMAAREYRSKCVVYVDVSLGHKKLE